MNTLKSIKETLDKTAAVVTFQKMDGSLRTMNCSLNEKDVPKKEHEALRKVQTKGDTLSVWDLDVKGWRSFRVDKVKSIKVM